MAFKQRFRCIFPLLILGFLVGTYNGRIAVWEGNDPEPIRVYPCPVYLLPAKERSMLEKGIRISDMEDVRYFLENFMA